ncbi:hypothetical protein CONLIGDRAFT_267039 [Coniochaeta ligniaria NRRL 30616]|uniref:UBL3-like ubiquitin domain-containing protein n=1 Tax=Coniochaeta ligniaria NRRL 30616 TaxID=1408157 RepID=A0A1J7JR04_9PEZI|nr:hypothetical protein CONLIGDRAFT_267039 [Coniochaeta ligniaria NRRL 30616]
MVDTEPQAANSAPAGDAPPQQPLDAVVQLPETETETEKRDDAAQASSEPIPPPASDPSSSEKPTSSDHPTSQPSVPSAATDSQKGKEKATTEKPVSDTPPAPPQKETDDSLSIEPSATHPQSDHPVCNITLLLPTGARHPYKIDERYLSKRGVDVPDTTGESGKKDPFSISVYTLKELILREWRDEWNDKPSSPSSIRLIHFGKLLDDKEQLKKYQFSRETPNVVHMSVRPAEMMEEDEAAKGKSGGREGRSREGSGNCCVIL